KRVLSDGYVNNFYHFVENGGEAEITSSSGGGDRIDAVIGLSNGRAVKVADVAVRGNRRVAAKSSDEIEDGKSSSATDETETTYTDEDEDAETDEEVSQLEAFLEDPATWAQDNPFPAASAIVAIVGLVALSAIVLMRPRQSASDFGDHGGYGGFDDVPQLVPEPAVVQVGAGNETVLMGIGGSEDVVVPDENSETRPLETGGVAPGAYAYLEFLDSDETRAPIASTNVRIGRHRDNDICIANHSVHRQHAVIVQDSEGHFAIRDLGTKNGIVVNNVRCSQTKLNDGDIIELGEVRLRYSAAS
ncbi:MAG: FHA domain-containing protein, partial [Pseudomonadota bacterium]